MRHALGDPDARVDHPAPVADVAVDDTDAMQRLQAELERGERRSIAGPPRAREDGTVTVPIAAD